MTARRDADDRQGARSCATGKVEVNWAKVATELGKRGAREAGKGAAALGRHEAGRDGPSPSTARPSPRAAARVIAPPAAAAAIGYGMYQGIKNARAAREAAQTGVPAARPG